MDKSDSIVCLTRALVALQGELKPVTKDSVNPFFKSKYADLTSIWDACRDLLSKHGFAVSQLPKVAENQVILTTLLLHDSGEWLSSDLLVTPIKPNDPQAAGSALTYARRYALSAILGVCSEEDDDGEGAVDRAKAKPSVKPATARQQAEKPSNSPATAPIPPSEFANAGAFLAACSKNLNLNRSQVLLALDTTSLDEVQFADAYIFLRDFQQASQPPVPQKNED